MTDAKTRERPQRAVAGSSEGSQPEHGIPAPKRQRSAAERKRARRSVIWRVVAVALILVLAAVLAVMVGDADYRATAIGWTPFLTVVFVVALCFGYLQVVKRRLTFEETRSVGSCERGQAVRFNVRFSNRCPLFAPRVEAHFFVTDLFGNQVGHTVTTMALAPFEEYEMSFAARFDHIGVYRAGLDCVVVTDFLRLFKATIDGPRRTMVQVTPHIVNLGSLELSNEAVTETTRARRSVIADSNNYAGVREYVKGDPLKTIHWKLSARQKKYYTRIYEAYTNTGVDIVLDFSGPDGSSPDELMGMFDAVVELALSAARYARDRSIEVDLHWVNRYGQRVNKQGLSDSEVPAAIGDMPVFASSDELHAQALGIVRGLAGSPRAHGNVIVCSANPTAEMLTALIGAQQRGRAATLFGVISRRLEGRDRDRWMAPLGRLDNAGVRYHVLSSSDEIEGGKA